MFAKLKKFIIGDDRPILRMVTHPVIGVLTYSDDDEAWLTEPKTSRYGFGFYISDDWDADGPEIRPATALVDHAAEIASRPEVFTQSVQQFIESQLKSLASDRTEIEKLRVYRVALMWPERPDSGEIELRTSPDTDRIWGCAYIDCKPSASLGFTGLDR